MDGFESHSGDNLTTPHNCDDHSCLYNSTNFNKREISYFSNNVLVNCFFLFSMFIAKNIFVILRIVAN